MIDDVALARMRGNLETFEHRARDFTAALETFRRRRSGGRGRLREAPLNPREIAILRMIAAGRDNGQIAAELHFGLGTIKLHVREILEKMSVSSRTEAAVHAVRQHLI